MKTVTQTRMIIHRLNLKWAIVILYRHLAQAHCICTLIYVYRNEERIWSGSRAPTVKSEQTRPQRVGCPTHMMEIMHSALNHKGRKRSWPTASHRAGMGRHSGSHWTSRYKPIDWHETVSGLPDLAYASIPSGRRYKSASARQPKG